MSYDDDEIGDDEHEVGTILRPLHRIPQNEPNWAHPRTAPVKQHYDPTVRWGDEVFITIPEGAGSLQTFTQDILNVKYGKTRGQTSRLWFHAEVVEAPDYPASIVIASQLELLVGCGSQTTTIRRSYTFLPQVSTPLDVSWNAPLQNIRGRVLARGNNVKIKYSLWLVPLVGGADEVL